MIKSELYFYRICFYINVATLISILLLPIIGLIIAAFAINFNLAYYFIFIAIGIIPSVTLWIQYVLFYFKYDKYSSAWIKLFFLSWIYAPFYFYNVIWKKKRPLQNF